MAARFRQGAGGGERDVTLEEAMGVGVMGQPVSWLC